MRPALWGQWSEVDCLPAALMHWAEGLMPAFARILVGGLRMNVAGRPVLTATYFPLSWSGEAFIPAMPSVRN